MRISVVFTVLNEASSLPRLLDSLAAQTRLPDEVVVCDGGSRDRTVELLHAERRLPLRIIESAGANISRGRNLAIAAATGEVIACTDAGVRLDQSWLETITHEFAPGSARLAPDIHDVEVASPADTADRTVSGGQSGIGNPQSTCAWVGGFFLPDARSVFELAMGATVLPALRDVKPGTFLPSSRSVAFLKGAWQRVGGYPEWLDYCEDLVFDLAMRECFGPCRFAPAARVYFRPRSSLGAFYRQYYLYARGDGKADLWRKRHAIRYSSYLIALPLLLAGAVLLHAPTLQAACVLALAAGVVAYTRTPYRRLVEVWGSLTVGGRIKAAALVPVIRVVGDVAKMAGYPAGVWWRLRRRT